MLINTALGAQWQVGRLSTSYVEFAVVDANTKLLETIKDALFYYAERIADIHKEVRELDELIKNQTRA